MKVFSQDQRPLDRILWAVIFIGMVASSLGRDFTTGAFFFMPVPLIVLNVLVSPLYAMGLAAAAAVAYGLEQGLPGSLAFLLCIGLFSQMLGFMIRRRSRVSRILFWGTALMLTGLCLLALGSLSSGSQVIAGQLLLYRQNLMTALSAEPAGALLTASDLSGFFPFLMLYLLFLFTAANFLLARWVLKLRGVAVIGLGNLSDFQLPSSILGGTACLLVAGYGLKLWGVAAGPALVDTLLYVSAFAFMFQGLGLCAHLLKRTALPALWHPWLLGAVLLAAGPVGLGIAGFIDSIMDLRKQRGTGRT